MKEYTQNSEIDKLDNTSINELWNITDNYYIDVNYQLHERYKKAIQEALDAEKQRSPSAEEKIKDVSKVNERAGEEVTNIVNMTHRLVQCTTTVELLEVLCGNPEAVTLTAFLDRLPVANAALCEGYLERHCHKGTHYYVVTQDGRMAVSMEEL